MSDAEQMDPGKPDFIEGSNGKIAFRKIEASAQGSDLPGLVWLGGFRSDMLGSKAETLAMHAGNTGQGYLRFDYTGHGESEGAFREGTISKWRDDAILAIENCTKGPQLLVGSSMGGWISMLTALEIPERIAGMILIAPAPDFTEKLMWANMDQALRKDIITKGFVERPSDYSDEPEIITHELIEDGRKNLVLDKKINIKGPIRILQGMRDADVPWSHALEAIECFESDDITASLIKSGDHRLSRDEDLSRLIQVIDELNEKIRL